MNKKCFISLCVQSENGKYNATAKAPGDVAEILKNNGWSEINIVMPNQTTWFIVRKVNNFLHAFKSLQSCRNADEIMFQIPFALHKYFAVLLKCSRKHPKISILIHDLDELRFKGMDYNYPLFEIADKIVVHTPSMKNYLVENGVRPEKIKVLYFFDYLVTKPRSVGSDYGTSVIFAGNLQKSVFLNNLSKTRMLDKISFHLYGASCPENLLEAANIKYCGRFQPDDISRLEGDWGLVWDGDRIDTCAVANTPSVGSYLRYNASHKISLYLAAGIPLIVWKESGLAEYIINNHLGIAVSSLCEIPEAISISTEEKELMRKNVSKYSEMVRNGEMLMRAIQ